MFMNNSHSIVKKRGVEEKRRAKQVVLLKGDDNSKWVNWLDKRYKNSRKAEFDVHLKKSEDPIRSQKSRIARKNPKHKESLCFNPKICGYAPILDVLQSEAISFVGGVAATSSSE